MADILTRREARLKSAENRDYTRGNFQLAMINAKNALRNNSDLRGRELRQTARRMVAGVGEYAQPSVDTNTSTTNTQETSSPSFSGNLGDYTSFQPFSRNISRFGSNITGLDLSGFNKPFSFSGNQPITAHAEVAQVAPAETSTTPQYKDGDDFTSIGKFGNAFAAARKAGLKTFVWNGKSYGTNTDPNWRERWKINQETTSTPHGGWWV